MENRFVFVLFIFIQSDQANTAATQKVIRQCDVSTKVNITNNIYK